MHCTTGSFQKIWRVLAGAIPLIHIAKPNVGLIKRTVDSRWVDGRTTSSMEDIYHTARVVYCPGNSSLHRSNSNWTFFCVCVCVCVLLSDLWAMIVRLLSNFYLFLWMWVRVVMIIVIISGAREYLQDTKDSQDICRTYNIHTPRHTILTYLFYMIMTGNVCDGDVSADNDDDDPSASLLSFQTLRCCCILTFLANWPTVALPFIQNIFYPCVSSFYPVLESL